MKKFNSKFDKEDFISFLYDFLPEDFLENQKDFNLENKNYKQIKKVEEVGYSESLDLHILIMDHDRENDPRISITTDAFKILADTWIHKALIIFKNKESNNYRLSYLTIGLDINDKNKAVKKYSNARRYSFYLGENAKTKTPEQQLVKQGRIKDIEDLQKRFSVEVVNKDFYNRIQSSYELLISSFHTDVKLNELQKSNFAIRLIGRIIFCWFLKQKKSVNGISLISNDLLSFESVNNNKNWYQNICEPLFFETLNKERRNLNDPRFEHVPYLNGGLFNSHEEDLYEKNNISDFEKINDKWFEDFFTFLNEYNFTIDENTANDTEISVDPEMLGKIFENLLAYVNPDTKESARKSTGSFYTPREIVEYMVDTSLTDHIKYKTKINEVSLKALVTYDAEDDMEYPLTVEEKIKIARSLYDIKIFDPACGSGAFPIGVLQKIIYMLGKVDPESKVYKEKYTDSLPAEIRNIILREIENKNFAFVRKLTIIRECIHGVDIQPIATDISRLRCFLTLIVDQVVDDIKPNRGIEPLPNLDFKFVCANTLISAPATGLEGGLFGDDFVDKLQRLSDDFFGATHKEDKLEIKDKLKDLISNKTKQELERIINDTGIFSHDQKMIKEYKKSKEKTYENQQKIIDIWNSYKNIFDNKKIEFFDTKYIFPSVYKKGGFDIVIGNPPYVGEKGNKETFRPIAESTLGKRFYLGKMDLFYFFFHSALDNLKEGGVMSFITTNYYITATGGTKLRKDIQERSTVLKLLNFGELKVFESALGQHNMITIIQKGKTNAKVDTLVTHRKGYLGTNILSGVIDGTDAETSYYKLDQDELYSGNNIKLTSGGLDDILNKIKDSSSLLGEISNVNVGLYTGADKVSNNYINKYKLKSKNGDGIFLVSQKEYESLNLNGNEKNVCVPMFKNSDINRYTTTMINSKYLIDFSYPNFIDYPNNIYPNILNHLSKFKLILENRQSNDNGLRSVIAQGYWWLFTKRKLDFDQEKIVAPQRSKTNTFGYNNIPWYASADVYFITKPQENYTLKFLLGVLNSHIIYVWLYNRGKRKGEMLELYQEPLSNIPIPKITEENKKQANDIEKIVNKILEAKKQNKDADTKDLEKEIDVLVYELYGLSEEEIKIIEEGK